MPYKPRPFRGFKFTFRFGKVTQPWEIERTSVMDDLTQEVPDGLVVFSVKEDRMNWKDLITKKFWDDVLAQFKKGVEPIPEELKKQYTFWQTRKFSPEVNAILKKISKYVSPAVVAAILAEVGDLKNVNKAEVDGMVRGILDSLKDILSELS